MESKEIISGSKIIAEYMGLYYLPFSAELKEKGMKAGYYEVKSAEPKIEKTVVKFGDEEREMSLDINLFRYHNKNGWKLFEGKYYKFVCRTHGELRYFNSLDSLVPVIQKIEKEFGVTFKLYNGGAEVGNSYGTYDEQFELPNWSNNVFAVVLSFLRKNYESK